MGPDVPRVALGPGAEFDLIRRFLQSPQTLPDDVRVGPGDDAAVLDGGWVVSVDLSMEDVHFRRAWLSDRELGYRAAAAALSDLAAMAARPVGALVTLALPRGRDVDAEAVHAGVREALGAAGAVVLGGDVTASPGPLALDVVVLGRAERPVLRAGARPGDEIWVTGTLGGSAAAVAVWERGEEPGPALREAFVRPTPRIEVARLLAADGLLRAAVDVSDGLAGDVGHLAAASGVGVVIRLDDVPVAPGVEAALGAEAALDAALHGGEDYELCFAAPPGAVNPEALASRLGVPLTRVGYVEAGAGVRARRGDEPPRPLEGGGFDHLAGDGP